MQFEKFGVQDPWFSFIKTKKKTIEGRLNKGKFKELKKGQLIIFENGKNNVLVKITKLCTYKSFEEYLSQEGLARTVPNTKTISNGVDIYRQFYSKENEQEHGILAIHFKMI